ncbi:HSF-type DNA-binding-domain-containing protein [Mycena galericulata]|nr:HSF-type DNA-binding-domain-containing protein [Mycena galericulata]
MDSRNIGRMSSPTDFIRKLYKILSDQTIRDVIEWTPQRDHFIVKDTEELRKTILPRMFKHSNFASFVRQLNKYGFRKVKNTEDSGEDTWTFQHPYFHADHRDALDKIKRKVPGQRKIYLPDSTTSGSPESPNTQVDSLKSELASMQMQLVSLGTVAADALSQVRTLEHSYQEMLGEMAGFQTWIAQQDKLLAKLVQSVSQGNRSNGAGTNACTSLNIKNEGSDSFDSSNNIVLLGQTQVLPLVFSPGSNDRNVTLARNDELQVQHVPNGTPSQGATMVSEQAVSQQHVVSLDCEELAVPAPSLAAPQASNSEGWSAAGGLFVGEMIGNKNVLMSLSSSTPPHTLRAGTSMFIPRWVVPPRVLVVEDDAITRKISGKFLQVFGCQIDVAVDGVDAVNKMTEGKYDLVLMDIVMPKLDGVSATSMIRTFDQKTPIISMTSNTRPTQLTTYSSSGMNDVLPKPFKKEGLLNILKKHLTHLTVVRQQMSPCFSPLATAIAPSPLPPKELESQSPVEVEKVSSPIGTLYYDPDAGDGTINPPDILADDRYNDMPDSMVTDSEFNLNPGLASRPAGWT